MNSWGTYYWSGWATATDITYATASNTTAGTSWAGYTYVQPWPIVAEPYSQTISYPSAPLTPEQIAEAHRRAAEQAAERQRQEQQRQQERQEAEQRARQLAAIMLMPEVVASLEHHQDVRVPSKLLEELVYVIPGADALERVRMEHKGKYVGKLCFHCAAEGLPSWDQHIGRYVMLDLDEKTVLKTANPSEMPNEFRQVFEALKR